MKRKCLIIVSFIILLFLFLQNELLQTTNYEIKTNKVLEEFNIVQISDLHGKSFGKNQKRLITNIQKINPNIVVITGDLMDSNRTKSVKDIQPCIDFVREITKYYPIYYVTGNHEVSNPVVKDLFNSLKENNVKILDEETVNLNNEISLTGIFDRGYYKKKNFSKYVKDVSDKIETDKYNVLLYHRPEDIKILKDFNFDVILSGHAHGGQWRVPFILKNGMYSPGQGILPKYTTGKHLIDKTNLIISRGLGNSRFPLRLFNYPEIVNISIEPN